MLGEARKFDDGSGLVFPIEDGLIRISVLSRAAQVQAEAGDPDGAARSIAEALAIVGGMEAEGGSADVAGTSGT